MVKALIAAVRSGDARVVDALLRAGADPDIADEHGAPVLCLAVEAFDLPTVETLLKGCARPDRADGLGRTPLLRAIELGSYDITNLLISRGAHMWITDTEGRNALALAQYWHETDLVAELCRRSGRQGPVARRAVSSDSGNCEQLSLGSLTIRTGHAAILTNLERSYGIATSFDELLSRALAEPDIDHAIWWETTATLVERRGAATWDAAAALRDRPDALGRYFGAEVLRLTNLFDESDDAPFDGPLVDLFLPWVASEPDPRVTRPLTAGLADAQDPRRDEPLTELTRHIDSKVRRTALSGLHRPIGSGDHKALSAAVERTKDKDSMVRVQACRALASAPAHHQGAADSLATCLTDPDEDVRVEAAVRLALRDDPRGDEILDSLRPTDEGSPYYWLLYDVSRHRHG
ncbi:ankyrin repeat domain-containing protein [Kitasatospora sp. NPDC085879]|uniref:ankyrin repeat domain-containing protein n=1 Tax=Kitasatospora sp. NPDC085879 TaxID=3154769 RepID=UPI0034229407